MPMIRHNSHPYDMHRIQVLINAGTFADDERAASALEQRLGALHGETLGPLYNGALDRIVSIPPNVSPQQFVQRFIGQPGVVDARTLPMRYTQASTPFFPNDAFFDPVNQWDLAGGGTPGLGAAPSGIGTPWAWGYTRGTSNVHIAIIDTGADLTAFDLQGKVDYSVAWVSSEQPYPNHNPGAAQDEDGHGTNVTGIAAADTNNSGYGFAGTGFNTPLQIYRIFPKPVAPCYETCSDYGASTADEANAIIDAINHHARVINLSLGSCEAAGGGPDPTEFNAIQTAIARGLVVVAAAGNERSGGGSDGCTQSNTIDFPAGYPGVISAGATSLHDNGSGNPNTATEYVASYSNSGPGLSVVAPGGDPPSSSDSDPLHWITNLYSSTVANPAEKCQPVGGINPKLCAALFAGTSQATPHVTGVAALMFSRNPALSPARVRAIIQSTADNINDPNQGHGRLDAYRALAAVVGDTTKLPAPTAVNFVAIAYTVSPGSNRPNILNQTFTFGVPLAINGTFRLVDVLPSAPNFEIGLWYDANGDGVVNAGDYFGKAGPCTATAPCSAAGTIPVAPVPPGFVLQ